MGVYAEKKWVESPSVRVSGREKEVEKCEGPGGHGLTPASEMAAMFLSRTWIKRIEERRGHAVGYGGKRDRTVQIHHGFATPHLSRGVAGHQYKQRAWPGERRTGARTKSHLLRHTGLLHSQSPAPNHQEDLRGARVRTARDELSFRDVKGEGERQKKGERGRKVIARKKKRGIRHKTHRVLYGGEKGGQGGGGFEG